MGQAQLKWGTRTLQRRESLSFRSRAGQVEGGLAVSGLGMAKVTQSPMLLQPAGKSRTGPDAQWGLRRAGCECHGAQGLWGCRGLELH